ncbi:hypothetical protein P879_01632 [Paragonimus westermani]|uniref:Ig-like domain-containing protein n=1 Tax=Paragonimus westermani TaxID=34504 RepID=A0A8T0DMW2_9TREM|nr:hypothetical protein P879_01632 [Paragonimus westermani]
MRHIRPTLLHVYFCAIFLRTAYSGFSSPPLFFAEDTDYIIISENESVILPCQASEDNDVRISWFKDETMIADNMNHSFRLSRATRVDTGIYYCIMRNDYGGIRGRKIKLETGCECGVKFSVLKIIVTSDTQHFFNSTTMKFNLPILIWKRVTYGKIKLIKIYCFNLAKDKHCNPIRQLFMFLLIDLDPTPTSTTRTLIDVRVGEALVFWPEAYRQSGQVGTTSTGHNNLTTVPTAIPPARARWTINNAPIANSPTIYLSQTEQALVLLNVNRDLNEMVIRAELTNGYGPTSVFTQSYVIGVNEPLPNQRSMRSLQLVLAPKDVVLVLRPNQPGQAIFECVFNARPAKSLRVTWFRKMLQNTTHLFVPIEASPAWFPAPQSHTERIYRFDQSGFNRSLTVSNIRQPVAYNAEEYTCQAYLDNYAASSLAQNAVVGGPFEEPLSATARLKINTPPALRFTNGVGLLEESVKNGKARAAVIQAVASSYVRLSCDIENEGHPRAEIVWLKNAQMISANDTRLVVLIN